MEERRERRKNFVSPRIGLSEWTFPPSTPPEYAMDTEMRPPRVGAKGLSRESKEYEGPSVDIENEESWMSASGMFPFGSGVAVDSTCCRRCSKPYAKEKESKRWR